MFRGILRGLVWAWFGLLASCAVAPLNVREVGSTTLTDGVHIRQVRLDKHLDSRWEKSQQLTCYAELQQSRLHGISCQNDLGFVLFSGGIGGKQFIFERNNPLFSEVKARFVTDLLRLDLFENAPFNPRYRLTKTTVQTVISDTQGNSVAEVRQ